MRAGSNEPIERHTFAVLVDNEPGVLLRVVGVLSARGYNIESLSVAEVDRAGNLSRITLVTTGSPMIIQQIKAQLERLVPVHRVHDLSEDGPHVGLELALIKVIAEGSQRAEAGDIVQRFGGRLVQSQGPLSIFEITDGIEKVDRFLEQMAPLGCIEVVRTGVAAISLSPAAL